MQELGQTGKLSVAATPIGNLEDASPRLKRILSEADLIYCEDTRVSAKLLAAFDIHTPLKRADEHTLAKQIDDICEQISAGKRLAFVSDAGMPSISDPGQILVDAALERDLKVEIIPGPSAVVTALVASGLEIDHFYFEGFLPRKSQAIADRLKQLLPLDAALVFYESPHRLINTVEAIAKICPQRTLVLCRELTKLHEEVLRDRAEALLSKLTEKGQIKGECVLVLAAPGADELEELKQESVGPSYEEALAEAIATGESKSKAAKRLAKAFEKNKAEVYDDLLAMSAPEL